jgi:sugar phosphate isomerase/epimerase
MQPSMSTCYLWQRDPYAAIECFAEHGWHVLELHYTHGNELLKVGRPEQIGDSFKRFAGDRGIRFPQGHFYAAQIAQDSGTPAWFDVAPADDSKFAQAMDDMHRWVDLFDALGVTAGVLHIGGFTLKEKGWSDERVLARRVQALDRIAEYAQGGRTIICLENLPFPGSGVETLAEIRAIASAVSRKNVAICLDTGHANVTGVNCPGFIREAGTQLAALHINDNPGTSDDHMLPYGRGTIPWDQVLQALRAINYQGPFNLEVPGEQKCPDPIRAAKLDYALRIAEWMIHSQGVTAG